MTGGSPFSRPWSLTEIAAAEGMDVGRVSRIIRLAQLSPEIVTACLGGSADRETLLAAARHAAPLD